MRCGEMWGDVGRCGEMWGDVGGVTHLHVGREVHVGHHALELRGELGAAAQLELRDHRALGVVAGGAREQQALRELLLVELSEDVLVGEVAEEAHDLLELVLEGVVRQPLARLFEQVVAKIGEQLRGAGGGWGGELGVSKQGRALTRADVMWRARE